MVLAALLTDAVVVVSLFSDSKCGVYLTYVRKFDVYGKRRTHEEP